MAKRKIQRQNKKNTFTSRSQRVYVCPKTGQMVKRLKAPKRDRDVYMMLDLAFSYDEALEVMEAMKKCRVSRLARKKLDEAIYQSQRY